MKLQISVSLKFRKFRFLIGLLLTDCEMPSVVLTFVNEKFVYRFNIRDSLTFRNLASYIYDGRKITL